MRALQKKETNPQKWKTADASWFLVALREFSQDAGMRFHYCQQGTVDIHTYPYIHPVVAAAPLR